LSGTWAGKDVPMRAVFSFYVVVVAVGFVAAVLVALTEP
jgi:hypothetical protein